MEGVHESHGRDDELVHNGVHGDSVVPRHRCRQDG